MITNKRPALLFYTSGSTNDGLEDTRDATLLNAHVLGALRDLACVLH